MTTDQQSPDANGSTCLNLLNRAVNREADAWQRVFWIYAPLIARWCRQANLGDADAADVRQEVFIAASEGLGRFRKDRAGDSFRGWLWGITQHKVRDLFRRRGHQLADPLGGTDALHLLHALPATTDDSAASVAGEQSCLVGRALPVIRGDFEEKTWQAFWQVTIEEQSPADVAARLGMTAVGVRKAKSRVLARLRQELDFLTS